MAPCDMTHLQGAVHHANDVVELLVIQYGPVLLHMQTQLLSQTLASGFALQGPKCSRQGLLAGGWREGVTLKQTTITLKNKTLQYTVTHLSRGSLPKRFKERAAFVSL